MNNTSTYILFDKALEGIFNAELINLQKNWHKVKFLYTNFITPLMLDQGILTIAVDSGCSMDVLYEKEALLDAIKTISCDVKFIYIQNAMVDL